jgi:hypothetical protein
MEDREVIEKRTRVEREEIPSPGVKNVNVGPDGTTDVQESGDMIDDPVGTTTVNEETTVQEHTRR